MPRQPWEQELFPRHDLLHSSAIATCAAPAAIPGDPLYPGRPAPVRRYPAHREFFETPPSSPAVHDLPLYAPGAYGNSPSRHARAGIYSSFRLPPAVLARAAPPARQYERLSQPWWGAIYAPSLALPVTPGVLP